MRLLQGKSRRPTLIVLGLSVLVLAVLGVFINSRLTDARMLRTLPDSLPQNAGLYKYAVNEGKGVFNDHCASCHGADMHGNSGWGVPNLIDADWLYGQGGLSQIEATVLYGIRSGNHRSHNQADMPAFGKQKPYARYEVATLTPYEISDIADYLRLAGGHQADPEAAKRGAVLFNNKGYCYDCHEYDLAGDDYIGAPNLRDGVWLHGDGSKQAIVDTISMGLMGVCPMFKNQLRPAQIRAVAAFIHSKAPARPTA